MVINLVKTEDDPGAEPHIQAKLTLITLKGAQEHFHNTYSFLTGRLIL